MLFDTMKIKESRTYKRATHGEHTISIYKIDHKHLKFHLRRNEIRWDDPENKWWGANTVNKLYTTTHNKRDKLISDYCYHFDNDHIWRKYHRNKKGELISKRVIGITDDGDYDHFIECDPDFNNTYEQSILNNNESLIGDGCAASDHALTCYNWLYENELCSNIHHRIIDFIKESDPVCCGYNGSSKFLVKTFYYYEQKENGTKGKLIEVIRCYFNYDIVTKLDDKFDSSLFNPDKQLEPLSFVAFYEVTGEKELSLYHYAKFDYEELVDDLIRVNIDRLYSKEFIERYDF